MMKNYWQSIKSKRLKQPKILLLALLLVAVVVGSVYDGYTSRGYIKQQKHKIEALQQKLADTAAVLRTKYQVHIDSLEGIKNKGDEFYKRYVQEFNRRKKAEADIRNIVSMEFSKPYLDSIAKYYKY